MDLYNARDVPADADPVRAHDDRVLAAVLAQIRRPGGVGELGPELEDVADLDPVGQLDRRTADRTGVALLDVCDVGGDVGREVASDVHVPEVVALAIRAGDEVRRPCDELVDHDDRVAGTNRRTVAGLHARGLDLLDRRWPEARRGTGGVGELRLVHVVVAANNRRHQPPVAGDEEGGLRRPLRADAQERRKRGDGRRPRRRDLFAWQWFLGGGLGAGRPRDLAVRRVAARVAQDEDVLARRVEDHELVGLASAHDPGVARHDLRLEP